MTQQILAQQLPVAIRLAESEAEYEVGVIFEGAFHVIQRIKAGRVTREVRLAALRAMKAAEQPPPPAPPAAPVA